MICTGPTQPFWLLLFFSRKRRLLCRELDRLCRQMKSHQSHFTFRKYTSSHTSHMSRRKTLLHISLFPYEKKIAFLSFISRHEFLSDRKFMHRLKSGSYTRTFSSECRLLVGKLRFNTTRLKWKPTTHVPCERAERPKSNSKQ